MTTLIQRGQAMLNRNLGTAAGVSVTYTRAAGPSATLTVWIGRTVYRRNQVEQGPAVVWGDRDYMVTAADFVAAFGAGVIPAKGDRLAESGAGTFEVMPPDTGEPAFRVSDQTRTLWRLHVKKVG